MCCPAGPGWGTPQVPPTTHLVLFRGTGAPCSGTLFCSLHSRSRKAEQPRRRGSTPVTPPLLVSQLLLRLSLPRPHLLFPRLLGVCSRKAGQLDFHCQQTASVLSRRASAESCGRPASGWGWSPLLCHSLPNFASRHFVEILTTHFRAHPSCISPSN